ncbi:MAG TPA: hypothetical protein VLC94_10200 [Candidatus Acidoferrum sp.]|nr:hypothetical protein [Candidatus Acidoferrum sp.]
MSNQIIRGQLGKTSPSTARASQPQHRNSHANRGLRWMCGAALTLSTMMAGAVLAPIAGAANSADDSPVVSYLAVDRSELQHLQRWVAAGHEDWCKDPRLVAAEQFKRMAPDFAADTMELQTNEATNDAAAALTFAWAPLDGRAIYRITVQRFDWLLPIAKNPDALIWVPTIVQVELPPRATHQPATHQPQPDATQPVSSAGKVNHA